MTGGWNNQLISASFSESEKTESHEENTRQRIVHDESAIFFCKKSGDEKPSRRNVSIYL